MDYFNVFSVISVVNVEVKFIIINSIFDLIAAAKLHLNCIQTAAKLHPNCSQIAAKPHPNCRLQLSSNFEF